MDAPAGPAEQLRGSAQLDERATREMLVTVARRYYLEDASKVAIAAELGISRFRVARLLTLAREAGVVRIRVESGPGDHGELAAAITERLGLRRCAVLNGAAGDSSPQARRIRLGELAAAELSAVLTPSDVLGLPWSRSASATVAALRTLPPIDIVQLSGARYEPGADQIASPADMVRDLAAMGGGRSYRFHAPFVAPDRAAADYLRKDPAFIAAHEHVTSVTVAIVGVGVFEPELSTLYGAASAAEIEELRAGGAVGEVSGVFVDAFGDNVASQFARRLLTTSDVELRAIPNVIGVCMGAERAAAVTAACRGGLLNSLVLDVPLAQELLSAD
ncbi:sugar-binding domain-containing protein [Dermatophilaceae bacterium Sec6.4]